MDVWLSGLKYNIWNITIIQSMCSNHIASDMIMAKLVDAIILGIIFIMGSTPINHI